MQHNQGFTVNPFAFIEHLKNNNLHVSGALGAHRKANNTTKELSS